MLTRIVNLGAWIAILVIGLAWISALTFNMAMAGSGAGTGVFSYWFRAKFQVWPDAENSSAAFGTIGVEGSTEPRFKVWGDRSPEYHQVKVDWVLFADGESKGEALIDLEHMQISHDARIFPLDADSLAGIIGIPGTVGGEGRMVTTLLDFLHSAGDGTLHPPNHHGVSLPEPLPGFMHHFASGFSLLPFELAWVLVWFAWGLRQWTRSGGNGDRNVKQA